MSSRTESAGGGATGAAGGPWETADVEQIAEVPGKRQVQWQPDRFGVVVLDREDDAHPIAEGDPLLDRYR